jgi:quercetin dioxygenase-like cupin family protein
MPDDAKSWPHAAVNFAELIRCQTRSVVSRILFKRPAGNVALFAFDAGQELSEHTVPFDAVVQVVDGEAEITPAGLLHRVERGEVLFPPAGRPKRLRISVRRCLRLAR